MSVVVRGFLIVTPPEEAEVLKMRMRIHVGWHVPGEVGDAGIGCCVERVRSVSESIPGYASPAKGFFCLASESPSAFHLYSMGVFGTETSVPIVS